jgi:hypothetical protein
MGWNEQRRKWGSGGLYYCRLRTTTGAKTVGMLVVK